MNKLLICYFSATGTTKRVAEKLGEILNGDLFEIEPVNKYTNDDLDWTNKQRRSTLEMKDESSRPEVMNKVNNLEEYNKVIIGFPVWWYREPSIVDTFIEENDLKGKDIYVYVTSGGSTYEGSLKHLKEMYSELNFVSGKTLNHIDENEIRKWVK